MTWPNKFRCRGSRHESAVVQLLSIGLVDQLVRIARGQLSTHPSIHPSILSVFIRVHPRLKCFCVDD